MRRLQHSVDTAAKWRQIEHIKVTVGIDEHVAGMQNRSAVMIKVLTTGAKPA
jgi:hypothetical protein